MPETLTKEQKNFLKECEEEFADRFTENDPEYKKVFDSEIPPPPIVCPWTINRRGPRGGGRRHQSDGSRSHSNNWNDYRSRERSSNYGKRSYNEAFDNNYDRSYVSISLGEF